MAHEIVGERRTAWERIARPGHGEEFVDAFRRRIAGVDLPVFDVALPDGTRHRLGGASGGAAAAVQEPAFRISVANPRGLQALASFDELAVGEAYLRGDLDVDGDFMSCLDLRRVLTDRHPILSLLRFLTPLVRGQRNSDLAWVPRHYDFGNEFYFAFLDKWVGLYSQALYTSDDEPLEDAVRNKLEYIIRICRLSRGSHVLDVGGGWGALEKHLGAQGIDSTMLTISREQFKYLSDWTATHGMPCRLRVVCESIFAYDPGEQYDAIVLLGVMEHLPHYARLFERFERLLKPGGRVYMDFAAARRKFDVSAFTYRYVFPGNHTPVYLPGLLEAASHSAFEPVALHNDRHSYYLTLQAWARNLEARASELRATFGEQVYRLFRLYLWGGAHQLQRDGSLESYRIVFQRARGRPSNELGCYEPV